MSPLEYIKEGILNGKWETVCEGYERLTGETLKFPKNATESLKIKDALMDISAIASTVINLIERTEEGEQDPLTIEQHLIEKTIKKTTKKKKRKKTVPNFSTEIKESDKTCVQKETGGTKFITNEPDPEEVRINKEKAKKTQRSKLNLKRKGHEKFKVKCNECEKTFDSDRPDGELGQKCNKCLLHNKPVFQPRIT